nr:uncharacterized protein CI109_005334 [Kwoniella shandongensis]KAA5526377.1 hypothetical protein CI109_005334 [Kwoniella shandongensis]
MSASHVDSASTTNSSAQLINSPPQTHVNMSMSSSATGTASSAATACQNCVASGLQA